MLRSLLFAPGNHPRKLEKVGTFGSDAIVLDLEDAVADAEKDAARGARPRRRSRRTARSTVRIVRVNGHDTGQAGGRPARRRLRRRSTASWCRRSSGRRPSPAPMPCSGCSSASAGFRPGAIRMLALIETARGLVHCEEIALAAPRRVLTLIFGLGDFSVDIGVDITPEGDELLYGRSRVVVAARAAGMRRRRSTGPTSTSRTSRAWRPTAGARGGSASRAASSIYPAHVEHRAARLLGALRRGGRALRGGSSRRSRTPRPPAPRRSRSTGASSTTRSTTAPGRS